MQDALSWANSVKIWMLDNDDDYDDDESFGVSVGDGEFAGDDAPHGKCGFFGTVATT